MRKKKTANIGEKSRDFLKFIPRHIMDWISAIFIRPSIKVTCFDIKESCGKKYAINFSAHISNNTKKIF